MVTFINAEKSETLIQQKNVFIFRIIIHVSCYNSSLSEADLLSATF